MKQIKFKDFEGEVFGGILLDNRDIICGCCGGVFPADEDEVEIVEEFEYWVNISEEIIGE